MPSYLSVYVRTIQLARGYGSSGNFILRRMREDIRSTLLDEFPNIDAREIAEDMDDALSVVWGPVDNYS